MKKIFKIEIATEQMANKLINQAVIAGLTGGIIHTALAVVYLLNPGIDYANPFSAIDAIFMLGLSYGVSRRSRVSATALFVYFLINKILALVEYGQFPNGVSLIFLYLFIQGMRATFAYHRLQKAAPVYA